MNRGARMTSKSSGSALARARIALGLTQSELAASVGTGQGDISAYERVGRRPRWSLAQRIATAVGLTVADLWPTLQRAVDAGRQLDTVIPAEQAIAPKDRHGLVLAYSSDDDAPQLAEHHHRPPLCCGCMFCRVVDLNDPETYRVIAEPTLIAAGGANA